MQHDSKTNFLPGIQSGLIAMSFLLLNNSLAAAEQKKPNLLFIMTDQQRFDALSLAGNKVLKTPNLDRLAKQGAWFRNAYTQCAVCAPTRASILTGCTIENHRILTNTLATSTKEAGVMAMPTFDELLSNHGYHCEYYGKWHSPEFHDNSEIRGIDIHNLNGQKIYSNKQSFSGLQTIDLPLESGICLVKVISEYPFLVQKLIVVK